MDKLPAPVKSDAEELLRCVRAGCRARNYTGAFVQHMWTLEMESPQLHAMRRLLDAYALAVGPAEDSAAVCRVLGINRAEYNKRKRAGAIPGALKVALQNFEYN